MVLPIINNMKMPATFCNPRVGDAFSSVPHSVGIVNSIQLCSSSTGSVFSLALRAEIICAGTPAFCSSVSIHFVSSSPITPPVNRKHSYLQLALWSATWICASYLSYAEDVVLLHYRTVMQLQYNHRKFIDK